MEKKIKIHIVPSTHWDREWYLPFRRFQFRLVRLMDKVIDLLLSGTYPYFVLDGQTAMVDDYLEIKPYRRETVYSLIKSGKLIVGPWFTVPDSYIPCGESLVKNLEIASDFCKEAGVKAEFGYCPDMFGVTSQMPQMFKQFGQRYMFYTRGQRLEGAGERTETLISAPDGSTMVGIYDSYNRGVSLVIPTVWRNIDRLRVDGAFAADIAREFMRYFSTRSVAPVHMVFVGVDHIEPHAELPETVAYLNAAFPDMEFVMSNPAAYYADLEALGTADLPRVSGEQRGDYREHFVLGNTLSSRMDVKMANRETEDLLFGYVEPITAAAEGADGFDDRTQDDLKRAAYRELVKSHAHDSICTCSVDDTTADVAVRLRHSREIGRELLKERLQNLGRTLRADGQGQLFVFNPCAFAQSAVIERKVVIPFDLGDNLQLADEAGNPVAATVRRTFRKRLDIESGKYVSYEELDTDTTRAMIMPECTPYDITTGLEISFYAEDLPALGYRVYRFVPGESCDASDSVRSEPNAAENEFLRVEVSDDGAVSLTDKRTGVRSDGILRYEWEEDDGDAYTFGKTGAPALTSAGNTVVCGAERRPHTAAITLCSYFDGELTVRTTLSLKTGSDLLYIDCEAENRACGRRLRAVFRSAEPCAQAYGDSAFDLTGRPVYREDELQPENIMTMPMRDVVFAPMETKSLAVFSRSVQEYEAVNTPDGLRLSLTLLRSVDKVYCMKTLTKDETGCGEGVRWKSKDLMMHGKYAFSLAVKFYDGRPQNSAVLNDALRFTKQPLAAGVLPEGSGAPVRSLARVENAVLSMFGRKDGADFMDIYNPDGEPKEAAVILGKRYDGATLALLNGETVRGLTIDGENAVRLSLRPGEVVRIRLEQKQ